jgi:hypothetical protein
MAVLGLIGGPLIVASGTAGLFGLYKQISAPSLIASLTASPALAAAAS